jgi:hypothetical protein
MTSITTPEGATFDAGELMKSMDRDGEVGAGGALDLSALSISSMVMHRHESFLRLAGAA